MSGIGKVGPGFASIHDTFQADAAPKFKDQAVKASTATRIGHAISGAFASFGRGVSNLFSRAADVFHGKETRAERQSNRLLAAYDRKLSGLLDSTSRGTLSGEKALNGFLKLADMERQMRELNPRFNPERSSMVMARTGALLEKLDEESPQAAAALRDRLKPGNFTSDTIRVGMENTYTRAHGAFVALADMFGEEPPPPLPDPSEDRHLESAVGRYHDMLMATH